MFCQERGPKGEASTSPKPALMTRNIVQSLPLSHWAVIISCILDRHASKMLRPRREPH